MAKDQQKVSLDISWSALLKIIALVIGIWAVFMLRDIIFMLLVVFIFVAAVNPVINRLHKYMSRSLAVAFFYALLVLILFLISWLFIPKLIHQLNDLSNALPGVINQFRPSVQSLQAQGKYNGILDQVVGNLSNGIHSFSSNLFSATLGFFGGIVTLISGLVLSFYLLLEEKNAREFFHQVLPERRYQPAYQAVSKISVRMGDWVRGQLLLMAIIAVLNLISFLIIGIPSPLPLALWSGLTEAVPYIGPILGVIPATIVAIASGSLLKVILVLVISLLLIQQTESNLIVPRVMSRAIGLSPVLVILAILIGGKIFGLVGALVAIPTAAIISVVVGEWPNLRKIWEEESDDEAPVEV